MSTGFAVVFEAVFFRFAGEATLDAVLGAVLEAVLARETVLFAVEALSFAIFAVLVVFSAFGALCGVDFVFTTCFASLVFFSSGVSEADTLFVAAAAFDRLRLATEAASEPVFAADLPDLALGLAGFAAFDGLRLRRFTGVPLMAVDSAMAMEGEPEVSPSAFFKGR